MQIKMGRKTKDLNELDFELDDASEEERIKFNLIRNSISEKMSVEQILEFEKRLDSLTQEIILKKADTLGFKKQKKSSLILLNSWFIS